MAEVGWRPLKVTPLRLLHFKSRHGHETQQGAALLSSFLPRAPFSDAPQPTQAPASASLPLLPSSPPPRRSVFCLLARSGCVVKPTALGAVASSPPRLSCLISEGCYLCPNWVKNGTEEALGFFLPSIDSVRSFPPPSVKSIPSPASPSPSQAKVCPALASWWPRSRPVPSECVQSSLVTLVMYGLGQVGVKLAACPIPLQMRRAGKTDFIYFHT